MRKSTRVTEKGRATIPTELHEKYDLESGDEIVRMDPGVGMMVQITPARSIGRVTGSAVPVLVAGDL